MSISPTLRGRGTGFVPERRAFQRTNVMDRRLVTVNLDNKDAGLMVDISEAGMAVQALARIKQGATTSLQFELPDTATRIEASGTVAWVDTTSGRAGIRFQKLDESVAGSLKQWLVSQPLQRASTGPMPIAAPATSLFGPESKVAAIATLQREIANQGPDREAALAFIVERARSLTRADGAAIALGDSKLMTCRASSGSAPPVGADLQPESGLSGECVRTGMTVRCEDTELDPRVDREACRSLKLRSAVIVPLFARGNISGLVEIFYTSPRGFEGRDVLTLRRMADLISATVSAPASPPGDAPGRIANANAANAPDQSPNSEPVRAVLPAPMIPPVPRVDFQRGKVVCDVCGHENPTHVRDCEKCDVPLPSPLPNADKTGLVAIPVGAEERQSVVVEAKLLRLEDMQQRRRIVLRLTARTRMLLLIAVLLCLVSILGWKRFKSHRASAVPPQSQQTETAFPLQRGSGFAGDPEFSGHPWVNTTSAAGLPMLVSTAAASSAHEALLPPASPRSSSVSGGKKIEPAAGAKNAKLLIAAKDVISTTPPSKGAALPSSAALAVPAPHPAETQGVVPPPLAATTPIPIVATILPPPTVAPKLLPATATVSLPRLLTRVEPVYPKIAQSSGMQGVVVLKATILHSGRLGTIRVVKGNDLLAGAAVHAVQQWRYKPMELDGKPVDTDTTIQINFSLDRAR